MKRDILAEINNLKTRKEFSLFNVSIDRLRKVKETLAFLKEKGYGHVDEFYKYIPISCIACIESYFRSLIKVLIDKGEPYTSNAGKFNQSKNIKFDFDMISEIQNRKLTIGEVVAHLLSCNNLEDINSNLSTILNGDFLKAIKEFKIKDHWIEERNGDDEFEKKAGDVFKFVQRTFELRHIYCHESTVAISVDKEEIDKCFESCLDFISQTSDFFYATLDEYYGKSPSEKGDLLGQTLDDKMVIVRQLLKQKRDKKVVDPERAENFYSTFDETYDLWERYVKSKARLQVSTSFSAVYSRIYYFESLIGSMDQMINELTKPVA